MCYLPTQQKSRFTVKNRIAQSTHTVLISECGHHICSCTTLLRLGYPCRHFYVCMVEATSFRVPFHVSLFAPRWHRKVTDIETKGQCYGYESLSCIYYKNRPVTHEDTVEEDEGRDNKEAEDDHTTGFVPSSSHKH